MASCGPTLKSLSSADGSCCGIARIVSYGAETREKAIGRKYRRGSNIA